MKTRDLVGPALDWAVAMADGRNPFFASGYLQISNWIPGKAWSPSTDWSQAGIIIEREEMQVSKASYGDMAWGAYMWRRESFAGFGLTLLLATMRCFVSANLGETVDIPEGIPTSWTKT